MRVRREQGFTLIELLVSISIIVVIISALSAALISFYENGSYTSRRDDHTAGAGLLGTYLNRDLAAATDLDTTSLGATCSGQTNLLKVSWADYTATAADPSPAPNANFAVYYSRTNDTTTSVPGLTGRQQLERWVCRDGTQVDHQVLVLDLAAADFSSSTSTHCGKGTELRLQLERFESDNSTAVRPYNYEGCVGGRQR